MTILGEIAPVPDFERERFLCIVRRKPGTLLPALRFVATPSILAGPRRSLA